MWQGSVVMTEEGVVVGPLYTRTRPVCLECLREGPDLLPCTSCGWPVCGGGCEVGAWHSMECEILATAKARIKPSNFDTNCPLFSCISPLRMLLLRRTNPDAWRVVDTLMDHNNERDLSENTAWKVHLLLMINFVQKHLQLDFTESEIRRAIGILRTNSVRLEHREGYGEGVVVYPAYSYTNHSCLCNTYTKKYKNNKMELIAQSDIKVCFLTNIN